MMITDIMMTTMMAMKMTMMMTTAMVTMVMDHDDHHDDYAMLKAGTVVTLVSTMTTTKSGNCSW